MPASEIETYHRFIVGTIRHLATTMRQIPQDRWEFAIAKPAPSSREIAGHCWMGLVCDRQHILEPDCSNHLKIEAPPSTQGEMCDLLNQEADLWSEMIKCLTPDMLEEPRKQFGKHELNVRFFLAHMAMHVSSKWGQFSMLYYAWGFDGEESYSAPDPNYYYGFTESPTWPAGELQNVGESSCLSR